MPVEQPIDGSGGGGYGAGGQAIIADLDDLGNFTGGQLMPVFSVPSKTETAGTAITELIPRMPNMIARLTGLTYTSAGTAHTVTVMRTVASTVASARAASGQKDIVFGDVDAMNQPNSSSDETIAANDWIVFVDENGQQVLDMVASVSGNTVTMTNNLSADVNEGGLIFILGEVGRAVHRQFNPPVSATTSIASLVQGGIPGQLDTNSRSGVGDPMAIHIDNAAAAGTLVGGSGYYVQATDVAIQ